MTEELIRQISTEVIRRLLKRIGQADGGDLIVVFTGATVAFREAVHQVQTLLFDGFRVQLAYSRAAEHLLAGTVKRQLDGFPNVNFISPDGWFSSLKSARAVVVPILSLNTVSKLSLLISDNLASNILLHALLMGKPLIMATDGTDPDGKGREELGFHRSNDALKQAMRQRLKTLEDYGCHLTGANQLANTVLSVLATGGQVKQHENPQLKMHSSVSPPGRITTAGDVLAAHVNGVHLHISVAGRITPLARDLARQLGVPVVEVGK